MATPVIDGQVFAVARDITERKLMEEALHLQSEITTNMSEGVYLVRSSDGVIVYTNPRFEEIFGYGPGEMLGKHVSIVNAPTEKNPEETAEEIIEYMEKAGRWEGEINNIKKDGTPFWSYASVSLFDDPKHGRVLVAVHTDITERKRAEEALRESEERYRRIIETAYEGIWLLDAEGKTIFANSRMAEMLEYTVEEMIGKTLFAFMADDWKAMAQENLSRRRKGVSEQHEFKFERKDGTHLWAIVTTNPILDEDGRYQGALGMVTDITERMRAEEELRESEEKYRQLFMTESAAILLLDADTREFLDVNDAAVNLYGYTREEFLKLKHSDITAEPDESDASIKQAVAGKLSTISLRYHKKKDGTVFPVEISAGSFVLQGRRALCGIIRDITERRNLEEQFRQSQKMEAIGRLAGGVAHDFNNLLTAMTGYSELILSELHHGDPLRGEVQKIKTAAERATSLTRHLLAFSRKEILEPKVLDLNVIVADTADMLQRLIGEDVELIIAPDPDLGRVKADPGHIEPIIMNLAVNARDAMPSGGKLTIETANVTLDEEYVRSHPDAKPGDYVLLTMKDTGCGMDAETQSHIFEPFFTTKEVGVGTGLGLSTAYGVVAQSGGYISVESEPGKGSAFKVYLPRLSPGVEAAPPAEPAPTKIQGTETVLLVEDEDIVRTLAVQILRRQGYTVLEARGGGEALLICERHKEPIHLLLTDVVMPQMSGGELAGRLAEVKPEMRVLYMSGYTQNIIVHDGILDKGTPFIQKPFTPHTLAEKVRSTLDRP